MYFIRSNLLAHQWIVFVFCSGRGHIQVQGGLQGLAHKECQDQDIRDR